MIIFVAAYAKKKEMGFQGHLPWPLMKADRAHLHAIADGKTVVMGEKTVHIYKSVNVSYATNRVLVLSRSKKTSQPGIEVVRDIHKLVDRAKNEDLYVVGGAVVFSQLLPYAQRMYVTEIDGEFEADTYFPEYSSSEWHISEEESHDADADNPFAYTFKTLERS